MARGVTPSAGFQLALPDSEQFSSPTDKAQNSQHSISSPNTVHGDHQNNGGNGQQSLAQQNEDAQQHGQGHLAAPTTQNRDTPDSGNGQQPQQTHMQSGNHNGNQLQRVISTQLKQLMQATAPAQNMTTQGKPTPQQRHATRASNNGTIGQTNNGVSSDGSPNVQPFNGHNIMASFTPVHQQQQLMMPAMNHGSQQVSHGYSRNNHQFVQPVHAFDRQNMMGQGSAGYQQNPVMMGQASMGNQQMHYLPGAMYTPAVDGNNIMSSAPLNGQQYDQGFFASNNAEQFTQGNAVSTMFDPSQLGVMMPGNAINFQPAMGHMAHNNNNNMDPQQPDMGLMPGSEQFQQSPDLQNVFQDMQGQGLLHRVDQYQQHQSGTPFTVSSQPHPRTGVQFQANHDVQQPTRVRAGADNQNIIDSMGA